MDADDFPDAVREAVETELSRLGSSKALYAATGGDLTTEEVLRAAADSEHHAAETFAAWAAAETDDEVADFYDAVAAEERDHYETVVAELDGHDPDPDPPALHANLRDVEGTVATLGAFVGRVLASDASKTQLVGYFTGQADPTTASLFRGLRADLDDQRDRALELLDDRCDDGDWEVAEAAAAAAVEAAYDEYVAALEAEGVNPKPVC